MSKKLLKLVQIIENGSILVKSVVKKFFEIYEKNGKNLY